MKHCSRCKVEKPLEDFYRDCSKETGRTSKCKDCTKVVTRQWAAEHPERVRERDRQYRRREAALRGPRPKPLGRILGHYSVRHLEVRPRDYEALLQAQGGGCAICGRRPGSRRLHIDHDHVTGNLRGLLCQPCNAGLGLFSDDIGRMQAAIGYLERAS